MEGYFWRFTDVAAGRVVVALCGVNRHPAGDWATVAIAAHPGGVLAHAAVDGAWASEDRFEVRAGDVLHGDAGGVRVTLDGLEVDARLPETFGYPRGALHAGGLVSVLPFLGQYWQPHVLGARVEGVADLGAAGRWDLGAATAYAEKNWGRGFPPKWWWGQAQGFDREDVCVAFGGGHLLFGAPGLERGVDIGGVVARVGDEVLALAPPLARVRTTVADGRWRLSARTRRTKVLVDGDGDGCTPHTLPVPRPAERRNVQSDFEHLAARMRVRIERDGAVLYEGSSSLAALEVGTPDPLVGYAELVGREGVTARPPSRA
jgi:hypothetical protein